MIKHVTIQFLQRVLSVPLAVVGHESEPLRQPRGPVGGQVDALRPPEPLAHVLDVFLAGILGQVGDAQSVVFLV